MQEPLPPPWRRRRRPGGAPEDTCPVASPSRASPPPLSLEAGAPPQRRQQRLSRGWQQQPPSASAASGRPLQPPWRLSLRAALLSLGVVVALFGPCARGWRVPGPSAQYGWGGPRRKRVVGALQPLAAIGGPQQPPQQRTSGGMVEDGQGQPPPPSSAAPHTSSGEGEQRRRERRGGGAPPRGDSSASRSRPSPSPSSASVASAALRVLPGEEALVAQLEDVRRRKRRGELRGLMRRLDLGALKAQGSLAVLETLARAAGACQDAGLAWEALQCLLARVTEEEREAGGVGALWAPRWDTFSLVMSACRRRRDLDALMRAFKAALPYSGHSRTVLLNILLAGLCDGGRMDVAAFYLDTAEEKWGVEPNTVSWNTLLSAAVRAGQPKLVADLEARMAARDVEGDVTTRNIRLQHLLATRPLEEALDYFDGLQREQAAYLQGRVSGAAAVAGGDDITPMDLRTLNILTSHIARAKGFDDAAAIVGAVQRKPLGVAPRAVTHNILLDALLKAGRVDEALEYFYGVAAEAGREQQQQGQRQQDGRKARLPPVVDSTTYDILLSGLVQNGRVSTAGVVYQMMGKAGLPPTIYTFAALVRLQKSASDVYRLWAQARATCGPRLSLPFLNLLIYELGQTHGDLQGALAAFRAILRTPGLGRPNTISYNSLLSALARDVNATVPALLAAGGEAGGGVGAGVHDEDEEEGLVVVAEAGAPEVVAMSPDMGDVAAAALGGGGQQQGVQDALALLDALGGKPVLEAALAVLRSLYPEASPAKPNARTFTILLAGIGKAGSSGSGGGGKNKAGGSSALCASLYREAEAQGVECNGIMAHALIRAFGGDAPGALAFFKKELRVRLKALDKRRQEQAPPPQDEEAEEGADDDEMGLGGSNSHMSLAYLALLHVCGLAGRPDLALQSVYAMQRDGLRADSRAWDAFASGKDAAGGPAAAAAATTAAAASARGGVEASAATAAASSSSSSSLLMVPYESLLRAETLGWEGGETFFKRIRIRF